MICQEGVGKAYVEPDKMTQEKIEDYLLCLKLDKSIAPNSCYERDISDPIGWNDDITRLCLSDPRRLSERIQSI